MKTYPSSRNYLDLSAEVRIMFFRFDKKMKEAGIEYIVTCTYRNDADQNAHTNRGAPLRALL